MVRVKIQLGASDNADKFVWRYPEQSRYNDLIRFVNATFSQISEQIPFQIQYRDDEGDLITCSSESDINDAFHFAKEENLKSLKLFIITNSGDIDDEDHEEIDVNDYNDNTNIQILDQNQDDNDNDEEDEDDQNEVEIMEDEASLSDDVNDHTQDEEQEEDLQLDVDDEEDDDDVNIVAEAEDNQEEEETETEEDDEEEEEEEEIEHNKKQQIQTENAEEEDDELESDEMDQPQIEDEEEDDEEEEKEEEATPTIKEILEYLYNEMNDKRESCIDFVVGICRLWPLNTAYPIHLGAMLQMLIEDKSKQELYAFIVDYKHYNILQNALKQYSGSDLQSDIKQMANLYHTVGVDKFECLSLNILKSLRDKLNGGEFQLDFGPLLQQTAAAKTKITKAKTKQKAKVKKAKSSNVTSATITPKPGAKALKAKAKSKSKSKPKAKSRKVTKPKSKPKSKPKPKRILHAHGAYISCHECDACPIRGARYVCMVRENYNLCEDCESKLTNNAKIEHPMIKIYQPRANWHIKNFKGLQDLVAIPETQNEAQPQIQAVQTAVSVTSSTKQETEQDANVSFVEQEVKLSPNASVSQTPQQSLSAAAAPMKQATPPQQPQIPLTSIMPSISTHNLAATKNQSLMDEIDALLAPKANTTQHKPQRNDNMQRNAQNGLDRLAFSSMANANGKGDDLSGLIHLVNESRSNNNNMNRNANENINMNNRNMNNNNMNMNNNRGNNGNVKEYNAIVCNTQHPGDIATNDSATMIWSIKNTGYKSFGNHCKLAFVSGDGLLVSQYQIPNALPNDVVKVSMSFNAFSTPGTYETNFRLCSNGKQFGPQLIVKMNVLDRDPRRRMHPMQPMMQTQQYPPQVPQLPPNAQYQRQAQAVPQWQHNQAQAASISAVAPPNAPYPQYTQAPQNIQNANYYTQQTQLQQRPQAPQQTQTQAIRKAPMRPQPIKAEPIIHEVSPSPEAEAIKIVDPQPQKKVQPQPRSEVQPRSGPSYNEATSLFPSDETDESRQETKGGWFNWGKKKALTKKESNLSCLCGATLIYLDVRNAYKGKKVYCDICSKVCKQCIFHCPSGDIKSHPGGFDLCYACGGSQLSKQPNPSPKDMYLSTDIGPISSSVYPALKPSAPPAPASPNKKSANYDADFMYAPQLKQLLDMGFDEAKAKRLLLKNRGNMSQVLAELIK